MTPILQASSNLDLCISGASISKCPWTTWVDFLKDSLCPASVTDYSCKGAGNQYIIRSAIHALQNPTKKKLLAVMLTNFDKYDMWVRNEQCQELQSEKHAPHWINGTKASGQGFWCTGSHFPLIKRVYREHFFDLEISAAQDITGVLGLVKLCEDQDVPLLIMFDSPVFEHTEHQINNWGRSQLAQPDCGLKNSVMVSPLIAALKSYMVDSRGLIGFCMDKALPWYNNQYGPHPPSLSHYLYFQDKIVPWISARYPDLKLHDVPNSSLAIAEKMTAKWTKKGF